MSRHILLLILLLPFLFADAHKTATANPISLGTVLVNEPDTEGMKAICLSHHYAESSPEDGYFVYTSADGYQIRFKMQTDMEGCQCPTVEITSDRKLSDIDKILTNLGFTKAKSQKGKTTYRRGTKAAKRVTTCTILSPKSLLLTKSSLQ